MVGSVLWIISVVMQFSLGLDNPEAGSGYLLYNLTAFGGIAGAMVGFLGLLWGGAFRGRLGPAGVSLYVLGWALIVAGGLALPLADEESPLFLLFPIGGNLQSLGYLLFATAAVLHGRWAGWQRWMPLVVAVGLLLTNGLPMLLGLTPDGPGMLPELLMGALWFGVGLAVFTAYRQDAPQAATAPHSA
jgi:hypothetical protein